MKVCAKCKENKNKDNFWGKTSAKDGLEPICKSCSSLLAATTKKQHKYEYNKAYRKRPEVKERQRLKRLAVEKKKRRNLWCRQFTMACVHLGFIIKSEVCQVCLEKSEWIDCHHMNYADPFNIVWLCRPCHGLTIRKYNRNGIDEKLSEITKEYVTPNTTEVFGFKFIPGDPIPSKLSKGTSL